jgi:hypothetical protein
LRRLKRRQRERGSVVRRLRGRLRRREKLGIQRASLHGMGAAVDIADSEEDMGLEA